VLEIGGGTGANLGYYGAGVESVTVTEPEPPMLKRLERKAREQNSQATVLRAPAEDLPFEDASFDTVVSTLVLCGVDDQPRVCASSAVCSGPAAGSSSSSTFARTTRAWRRCRTG
jgi:Methylase involved in ubiquinone/menaquinone biosynthesis